MDPETRTHAQGERRGCGRGADQIFQTLMGDDVEPRRLFIEANAQFVNNLDI